MRAVRARRERDAATNRKPGRKYGGFGSGVSHGVVGGGAFWRTAKVGRIARSHGGMRRS